MGRYAPSGTNLADNNLLSETEQLIDALDAAFKKDDKSCKETIMKRLLTLTLIGLILLGGLFMAATFLNRGVPADTAAVDAANQLFASSHFVEAGRFMNNKLGVVSKMLRFTSIWAMHISNKAI